MYSLQTTSFWALLVQHCIIDDDVSWKHERKARYTGGQYPEICER